ncbi:uncharacterized protein I206_102918 [Kwoniella pini CBS 10737]|uniref:Uncharacterized protein n=1 Tax=Kwoniella pini CBS 10737 TaxID=1296096 RepID=A0A1B9I6P7_9TREE|nr:uncharacterized protein I206_03269 [Kwoniella pini CBS 10737]OCF51203.1 hypothetical protein I206_03269 [Kwoniella pini CBS 10737]
MFVKSTLLLTLMSLAGILAEDSKGPTDANIVVNVMGDTKFIGETNNFHWNEDEAMHPTEKVFKLEVNDKYSLNCGAKISSQFRGYETFTIAFDPFAIQTANGRSAEAAQIACPTGQCLHDEKSCGDMKTWNYYFDNDNLWA